MTLHGSSTPFCDGVTRRGFLKAGFLGLGGLTLSDLLRIRAAAGTTGISGRSVIYIELAGGPSHFETYDPKPNAPQEYRGPFGVAKTNIPGIWFSELMKEQAAVMDKLAVIRSIHHDSSSHDTSSHLTQTGYYKTSRKGGANTFPSVGAFTAKLKGPNTPGIPPYVAIGNKMRNGGAAFVGKAFGPFETGGNPNDKVFNVRNLDLAAGLNVARLEDRRGLETTLDEAHRLVDNAGAAEAVDQFQQQAFELLLGDRARRAFDISQEPAANRDRYGRSTVGQSLLLARRMVEAGSAFVTLRVSSWDDHTKIKDRMESKGPDYDRGVAALVSDLHERGLDRNVLVVAMGEFGRTPRINRGAGRDHWGKVMSVLLAGGGLNVGQVIGASTPKGEEPADAPYRPEHVLAMVYRHLGIDPSITIPDHSGRPRYLLEERKLISELI